MRCVEHRCCAGTAARRQRTSMRFRTCSFARLGAHRSGPEILELDINPLKVLATGACAIDARIRVGHLTPAPSQRVIY